MSRYHYAQPDGIARERRITEGQSSMAGVMNPTKFCFRCKTHKPLSGCTRVDGRFVCAGCK